ncbi:hypothetical protein ACIBXA_31660 [Micromonospora echinaurantiaca]|uniref:hypothetical protein n=1 Tax=Micromonospora echinaurantiaca TaxID=47857 RepID=UPI00378A0E47
MRWPRQLMSLLLVLTVLAGPPVVLLSLIGPPIQGLPDEEQMQALIEQPLTEHTLTTALTVAAWLVWLLLAYTVTIRILTRLRATVAWLRRLPLPTPLQATASGMAGAAVLSVSTTTPTTPPPQPPPPATAGTVDEPGDTLPTNPAPSATSRDGVVVAGGWLPRDTAEQVAAAAALVWLRRRRDYQPRTRKNPDLTPLPATAVAVQAALADQPPPAAAVDDPADVRTAAPASGTPALLDAIPATGVGLTGPGAPAAGRGLLVTALLAGRHQAEVSVVVTRAVLTDLLGPRAATLSQRLIQLQVVDGVDEAARVLASTRRAGLAPNARHQHRHAGSIAAKPTVLLTADDCNGDGVQPLVDAMAAGDGVLAVLGGWQNSPTWHIDHAGHTHDPHRPGWAGPRWCVLDPIAATDLLTVIAHTNHTPPNYAPLNASTDSATGADRRVPRQASRHEPRPRPTMSHRRLQLRVLGEPALLIDGEPLAIRRSAAIQVLVFLAAHPSGADTRQLTDATWPGLPRHSLTGRLYTTLSDLRGAIRTACGLTVIDHTDDRYRLNPDHLDVDLWHLHTAVRHATTALTDTAAAWQAVIDAYPDDLAAGRTWPWLDPIREHTRRHAIDAYAALAAAEPDPRRALQLLQNGIRVDPYNADLHTRALNTLATLGDQDTAAELRESYTRRLHAAGLHPGDDARPAVTV